MLVLVLPSWQAWIISAQYQLPGIKNLIGQAGPLIKREMVLSPVKVQGCSFWKNLSEQGAGEPKFMQKYWDMALPVMPIMQLLPCQAGKVRSDVRFALSNSFGFGGINASLVFKKYEE